MAESQAPEDTPKKPATPEEQAQEEVYYEEAPDEFAAAQFADRALIRTLIQFIGMTQETEAPSHPRVRFARDMAVIAAYERVRRVCSNDTVSPEELGLWEHEENGEYE